jgi:hypothetical protein
MCDSRAFGGHIPRSRMLDTFGRRGKGPAHLDTTGMPQSYIDRLSRGYSRAQLGTVRGSKLSRQATADQGLHTYSIHIADTWCEWLWTPV